jgi:nucleotidyltransferase substrate binding protein (TIGR01987 family)
MKDQHIRWKQRFANFIGALDNLTKAVALSQERELSNLEKQGLIQTFKFTHELAWKVMKDYFFDQGNNEITGARDAARMAFQNELIIDAEGWMDMIKSRNLSSHTYNDEVADEIAHKITDKYAGLFDAFRFKMQDLLTKN